MLSGSVYDERLLLGKTEVIERLGLWTEGGLAERWQRQFRRVFGLAPQENLLKAPAMRLLRYDILPNRTRRELFSATPVEARR